MLAGDELVQALEELLDRHPAGEDAPYLGYVDGALAGLLVLSDLPAEEWLPKLGAGPDTAFANPADGERYARVLQDRKAEIAGELLQGGLVFAPLYDFDDRGEPAWQIWLLGFSSALAMRQDEWMALLHSEDEDLAAAAMGLMSLLATLPGFATLVPEEETADLDELVEQAPDLIPYCIEVIYRRQRGLERVVLTDDPFSGIDDLLEEERPFPQPVRIHKIGRNEPCPCGSGKKYKKCCGAAA
jgi:uncharacterized protein